MNEENARAILGNWISTDGGLFCLSHYIGWNPGELETTLDDRFTADQLEAIAWWMRNSIAAKTSGAMTERQT